MLSMNFRKRYGGEGKKKKNKKKNTKRVQSLSDDVCENEAGGTPQIR